MWAGRLKTPPALGDPDVAVDGFQRAVGKVDADRSRDVVRLAMMVNAAFFSGRRRRSQSDLYPNGSLNEERRLTPSLLCFASR
jgi:hypothetical protein